ncbi:hypothetical protein ISN44_As06g016450 [Arabidopsis suecica]|uniref:At4g15545-like C-terminal domain-containing protein n=1 Tax=Arabidopsis suecica TaxID=45249 RepID=A0A8T2CCN6_ARASU|nr:hypothetical protein ISN44_As06g016450 [Arabidopsis suecica]
MTSVKVFVFLTSLLQQLTGNRTIPELKTLIFSGLPSPKFGAQFLTIEDTPLSPAAKGTLGHSCGGEMGDDQLDFELPEEVLSVIPMDPFEQLDLARKITSMAIASRVSNLDSEVVELRQKLLDKESVVRELEEKASRLERDCREADSRLKVVLEDNMNLTKEKDSLAMTVTKLTRDLAKLETFKRQLIKSLSDESGPQTEPVDIRTCDHSVPKGTASISNSQLKDMSCFGLPVSYLSFNHAAERTNAHTINHAYSGSTDMNNPIVEASKYTGNKFSMTPYISPRLTPTATPKIISTSVSPRGYSAAGSPKRTSGAVSPTKATLWYPSSQQSSAANSPPRNRTLPARTPRMDGKEFFRQARSRLSYEQFSSFLANIKELNAQKQTREETLRKADEIFGEDNKDLYLSFQGLLNRNMR